MRIRDKEKLREYSRKHYEANKAKMKARARKWTDAKNAANCCFLLSYLAANPCVDCGESDPVVLEFDHVAGKKRCAVSRLAANMGCSRATLEAEMRKCVVRCANCHRRKTAKERGWYRARAA